MTNHLAGGYPAKLSWDLARGRKLLARPGERRSRERDPDRRVCV